MNPKMKGEFIYLSYAIDQGTPAYGNGEGFSLTPDSRIASGDSCNSDKWQLPNHLGTHVDFPSHFVECDLDFSHYDASFWVFSNVQVVDLSPCQPGSIISPESFEGVALQPEAEMLLVKTGFCQKRKESEYWQNNPGFSPELADYLRQKMPSVRLLGFDSISLSSYANRPLGRLAHKAFLAVDQPILPLEDMDLGRINAETEFLSVVVAPLPVKAANGSPCNVIAEIKG
jgi:arylformamidase